MSVSMRWRQGKACSEFHGLIAFHLATITTDGLALARGDENPAAGAGSRSNRSEVVRQTHFTAVVAE